MAVPPKLRRVLVVYKASKLDRYRERGTFLDGMHHEDKDVQAVFRSLEQSHARHEASIGGIEGILESSGLEVLHASQPRKRDAARVDLVIAVGGDGTFLLCARKLRKTPILGINSAPGSSVGYYSAATQENLPEILDAVRSGKMQPTPLNRIEITLRNSRLPYPALNDMLFAHRFPGAATHYLMRVGEQREVHVSSGIWVATATGSTAGIRSAGGEVMPLNDRRLQYLVREPYQPPGASPLQLKHGYSEHIKLVSRSPSNLLFIDGADTHYQVGLGETVHITPSPDPLLVYGFRPRGDSPPTTDEGTA